MSTKKINATVTINMDFEVDPDDYDGDDLQGSIEDAIEDSLGDLISEHGCVVAAKTVKVGSA